MKIELTYLIMPPKKRKGSGKEKGTTAKQPKQEGQKAVSHDIDVPIDEGFKGSGESFLWGCNGSIDVFSTAIVGYLQEKGNRV